MSSMTRYLQKALLDHTLNLTPWVAPTALYLSLHTASPTESGSRVNEVSTSGSNYARQLITGKMGAADLTTGRAVLTGPITTLPALTDWGTINYTSLDDDPTSGTMLFYAAPTTAQTITVGEAFQLVAGQFAVRFS